MLLTIRDLDPKDLKDEEAEKKGETVKPEPWVIDRLQFKQDYVGYLNRLRTHFYLYNGEGEPVQITSGDYDDSDPQWSPDGDRIAFVSKREGDPDGNDNSDIWTVSANPDAKSYPLVQITTNKGSDKSPSWSPDGKTISYTTVTEPEKLWYATEKLAVIDADGGGTAKILTSDYDRMVFNPEFSSDGKSIYFTADDGGNSPLVKANASNGRLSVVTPGDTVVREFALDKKGSIATIQSSHHMPFDVFVINKGKSTRISKGMDKLLREPPGFLSRKQEEC